MPSKLLWIGLKRAVVVGGGLSDDPNAFKVALDQALEHSHSS